jgi:hypothetical protein
LAALFVLLSIGWPFGIVAFGIGIAVYRIYQLTRFGVKGLAFVGQIFRPDVIAFRTAMGRSVNEGPVASGFLGMLAFGLLAALILFAVTGVRV